MTLIINSIIAIIAFVSCWIYYRGIRVGRYTSSLAAWLIWSCILTFLSVVNVTQQGWTQTSILLVIQAVTHIAMLIVTYKYVEKRLQINEKRLLLLAVIAFVIWLKSYYEQSYTEHTKLLIGIFGQIIADAVGALAFIPLVIKYPYRIPATAWALTLIAYPLTMLNTHLMHESGANYIYPIYGFLMYSTLLLVLLYGRERMYEYLIYPLRKEIIKIFIERSFYHQSTQTPSKPGDKIVGVLDDYHKALMTVLMQKEEKRSRYIAHLARVFCSTPQAIEYSLDQRKLIVMREADKRIVAEIITLEKELHLLHRALIQSLQEYLAGDDKVLRIGNDFQVIENKEMKL